MGMSWLKDGEVNICGLFRRPAAGGTGTPADWREMMRGPPGTARYERLERAEFDEGSFCSVAGLSLEPRRAAAARDCRVGDAITMIPPVTGNGMSMAFESAELAIEPLAAYSGGQTAWNDAESDIALRCDERFSQRLAWAGFLQRLMFMPRLQNILVLLAPRCPAVWRLLVARTR
jgi:flavin-dependent dehydrogenase